ncbi:hypothetical protein AAC387_Pa06g1051 [Persea americana]
MGARALQSLIFLVGFLFCSGTSVQVSFDGRNLSSFPADSMQFLKQHDGSRIHISDGNHGLLRALCGEGIDVNLYISTENILTISKSRGLAAAWVQREVASFVGCINITGIVVNSELIKDNHLPLLLPTLKFIDSALVSLSLDQSIELSALFALPFIEDCFRIPQNPSYEKFRAVVLQVLDFLNRPKSSLTISSSCNEKLGLGDCLIGSMTRAISVLPDHKILLQFNLRSPPFSSPMDSAELDNQLMSVVRDKKKVGNRSVSFVVKKPWASEFEQKEQAREKEQLFPSSHRELVDSELDSIGSMPQLDVVTPSSTVPVVNPMTPTSPSVNPLASPSPPTMTPITTPYTSPPTPTTTTPITTPYTSPPTTTTTTPPSTPSSSSGQWCVASPSASPTALQVALDYACGFGGADCSAVQKGGSCFNPDTVRDHASYAFNDYYQKNPVPTSCNFGGTATLTNTDPSTSTCQFPSSSSSSNSSSGSGSSPSSGSSSGTSPSVINTTNPTTSIYGTEPPGSSDASVILLCFPFIITLTGLLMPMMAIIHI